MKSQNSQTTSRLRSTFEDIHNSCRIESGPIYHLEIMVQHFSYILSIDSIRSAYKLLSIEKERP